MTRWIAALVVLVAVGLAGRSALGWLLQHPVAARLSTRWIPPEAPLSSSADQQSQEREALRTLGRQVRGRIVWSSNRGGNHDLYEADLATGQLTQLTSHPHVDYFSRYSPDGHTISFLRSRRLWVSFREADGWDLFVMNADGTGERRLTERASHATWTPDGRALTFRRDNRIFTIDVKSGAERLLYDGAERPLAGDIGDPELGPDGLLALSLRGVSRARQGVGILSPQDRTFTRVSQNPSACHISWVAGGRRLVWIEGEGHGGTRVMHTPVPDRAPAVLIDLPGAYSHEYFPRVSQDGRWLIWGAAAEGHEHDRADYEIFAWRIGTPPEYAVRLTNAASNDQWPDFWVD